MALRASGELGVMKGNTWFASFVKKEDRDAFLATQAERMWFREKEVVVLTRQPDSRGRVVVQEVETHCFLYCNLQELTDYPTTGLKVQRANGLLTIRTRNGESLTLTMQELKELNDALQDNPAAG